MHYISQLITYLLHIDSYLFSFVYNYGNWAYLLLFCIIFCETGLVITPFLPGDSLLFVSGTLAAQPTGLTISALFFLLCLASIIGNQTNYCVGKWIGPAIFSRSNSKFFNKKQLVDTQQFYEKHGGKTIIFARFIPIIRSFAPFVAGIGAMQHSQFFLYNIASAILWIGSLLSLGYFFGALPFIKHNFSLIIYGIIILSLLPAITAFYSKNKKLKS